MIRRTIEEFSENGLAVRVIKVSLLGLPLYFSKKTSTNIAAIQALQTTVKHKIKGFKYETKNKSKKN